MKKLFFLLLTAVCALLYAPPAQAWTVYLTGDAINFTPKAYIWDANETALNGAWAGKEMTKADDGRWVASGSGIPVGVIFTDGGGTDDDKLFNGNGSFYEGYTYQWNGSYGESWPSEAPSCTFYFDNSAVAVADVPFNGWNPPKVYYNGTHNDMTHVSGDIWSYTIANAASATVQFTDGDFNSYQNNGHNTVATTVIDGYVYKITDKDDSWVYTVDKTLYNPTSVSGMTLYKDGDEAETVSIAPWQFTLASLTGTEVFKLKVTLSDGSSKWYIRDNPDDGDTSTPYTLVEGNEYNSFLLNTVDADNPVKSATMTVNFDTELNATGYTLSNAELLNDAAHVWLYDGSTAYEMTHRRDGKYVLEGLVPEASKSYTVVVNHESDQIAGGTSYTIDGASMTGAVLPLKEGSAGFAIDSSLDKVNVSVRLTKGAATKIALTDPDGYSTIYFRNSTSDWGPYVRLSSDTYPGYYWVRMTSAGVRGVYKVTFDPMLYNYARFLRADAFDGNANNQTVYTTVANGHIYSLGDGVTTEGDNIGRSVVDNGAFTIPVRLSAIYLVDTDGATVARFNEDASGNYKVTLSSTLTGSYRIMTVGTTSSGEELKQYYSIDGGSISSAAQSGTGKTVMGSTSADEMFKLEFVDGGTSAIMSLVMADDGSTPVSAYLTDPSKVISAIYLVNRANESDMSMRFLTSDGGLTWYWQGKVEHNTHYYLRVIENGTAKAYTIGSESGYELKDIENNAQIIYGGSNPTWQGAVWNETVFGTSGNDMVFYSSSPTEIEMKIETQSAQTALGAMQYSHKEYNPLYANVFMPLSRADFAAGPRYFLVGTRTADWRLQPEWEMIVDDSGSSATLLPGRLMYKQLFGIAKVDSYDDYIMHRYSLYTCQGAQVTASGQTFSLTFLRDDEATDYDASTNWHNTNTGQYMKWCSDNTNWDPNDWIQAKPALITSAVVTLDADGTPTQVRFDYDDTSKTVAENMSFTLVGSTIGYDGLRELSGGSQMNLYSLTPGYGKNQVENWQNSWIQENAGGVPYIDGRGQVLYNTAFDATWMKSHYNYFYNEDKNFTYNSQSLTFIPASQLDDLDNDEYADLYKMHPEVDGAGYDQIGNNTGIKVGVFTYDEIMHDNSSANRTSITDNGWQCMVVKDMWLSGAFKIWSGWGGNLKTGNDVGDGTAESAAQWFYENGGHAVKNTDYTVTGADALDGATQNLYATTRNIDGADFAIDGMRYFPRVILWYNPDEGFANSALQLIAATVGPNIQAFYNADKRSTLKYYWWVSAQSEEHDTDLVYGYTINRYKTKDGVETMDKVVENVTFATARSMKDLRFLESDDVDLNATELDSRIFAFIDDSEALEADCLYRYEVKLNVHYTVDDKDVVKTARSNRLPIYAFASPVIAEAKQQTEGTAEAPIYSFNVELNARLSDLYASRVVNPGAEQEKTVAEALKSYIVTVSEEAYSRLSEATSLTVGDNTETPSTFFKEAGYQEVQIGNNEYLPEGTRYFVYDVTMAGEALPAVVWHNVAPTTDGAGNPLTDYNGTTAVSGPAYDFTVYLVSEDDLIDEWATMNFTSYSTSATVTAPATTLAIGQTGLRKAEGAYMVETEINKQPAGTRSIRYSAGMSASDPMTHIHEAALPIHYQRLNETYAEASFDALPVTQEVVDNHKIEYTVYATEPGTTLAKAIADNNASPDYLTVAETEVAAANTAKTAVITNLDLTNAAKEQDVDGHSQYIKGDTPMTFDTHLRVAYTRAGQTYYNDEDKADKDVELNFAIGQPSVSVGTVKAAKYRDQYWWLTDESTGAGNMIYPGYFAHGIAELELTGIDNTGLNAYVGFHAQQPYVTDKTGDCYQLDQNNTLNGDIYTFSFCGTRAANGGHPMNGGWASSWTDAIAPLSAYAESEGSTITYQDYVPGYEDWSVYNDWSTMAAASGRLPLHINPIYDFEFPNGGRITDPRNSWNSNWETDYNTGTISDEQPGVNAQVSAIYPVANDYYLALTFTGEETANSARAKAPESRETYDVFLVGRKSNIANIKITGDDVITGVEEILGDADQAEPEYYNLQGIRVHNPAKGQIYIVRRGAKVAKVLYK